jgi:hydrogenase expression/formation protein HypE
LFGIDPLFVANEGKLVAFVQSSDVEAVLCAMKSLPEGKEAAVIGSATDERKNMVLLKTEIGGTRIIELPFSEQLPRIC